MRLQTQSIDRAIQANTKQFDELTGLRLRNLLTDEEYLAKRRELQQEQLRLSQQRAHDLSGTRMFEPIEDVILFCSRATEWFRAGDDQAKRLILETVGSNHVLRDKALSTDPRKPFRRKTKWQVAEMLTEQLTREYALSCTELATGADVRKSDVGAEKSSNVIPLLATGADVRSLPDRQDIQELLDDIREALAEDPQEAATLIGNIKMLRRMFGEDERKVA